MFIRIEFENIDSPETEQTQFEFMSSPNGTCLTSSHAHPISAKNKSVVFWYLDVNILNRSYGGVMECFKHLLNFSGVKRIDILPVEGKATDADSYTVLETRLMDFVDRSYLL
jgi:hypothetical protein